MSPSEFRCLREAVGYSIEDIARHLSVSRSIVQKWEAGDSRVPDGVAEAILQLQDEYADARDAALAAAPAVLEVWRGVKPQDDASWDATGRPSRWHRQIAAECFQEHGTKINYVDDTPAQKLRLTGADPMELLS